MRWDQNLLFNSNIFNLLDFQIAPHATIVARNIISYGALGGNISFGNKIGGFGSSRFNYFSGSDVPEDLISGWVWSVFFGAERRKMESNYILEGKTIMNNLQTVNMKGYIDEFQTGIKLGSNKVLFDLIFIQRGIEFVTQTTKQKFIRIGFSYKF